MYRNRPSQWFVTLVSYESQVRATHGAIRIWGTFLEGYGNYRYVP